MTDFPDLRHAFPHTAEFIVNGKPTLHDVGFQPTCGYVSIEEAELLWRIATDFPGRWCEVGSHTGFSGAHIAAAGVRLLALDPQYEDPSFLARAERNLKRAGVRDRVQLSALYSWQLLPGYPRTFHGAFVDGDHEPGKPLEDTQLLEPLMEPRAVIVLHDGSGRPVQEAAEWLVAQDWQRRVFETMGTLNVCWRGEWEPPA